MRATISQADLSLGTVYGGGALLGNADLRHGVADLARVPAVPVPFAGRHADLLGLLLPGQRPVGTHLELVTLVLALVTDAMSIPARISLKLIRISAE